MERLASRFLISTILFIIAKSDKSKLDTRRIWWSETLWSDVAVICEDGGFASLYYSRTALFQRRTLKVLSLEVIVLVRDD